MGVRMIEQSSDGFTYMGYQTIKHPWGKFWVVLSPKVPRGLEECSSNGFKRHYALRNGDCWAVATGLKFRWDFNLIDRIEEEEVNRVVSANVPTLWKNESVIAVRCRFYTKDFTLNSLTNEVRPRVLKLAYFETDYTDMFYPLIDVKMDLT